MSNDPDAPVRLMAEQWTRELPEVDVAAMALFGRLSRAHTLAGRAIDDHPVAGITQVPDPGPTWPARIPSRRAMGGEGS